MSEPMIAIPVSLAEKLIEHLEWDGEPELTGYQYGSRCDARAKELRHYLDSSSLVRGGSFTVHGKSPYISTGFVPSVLAFKLPAGTHELLLIDAAMRAQGDGE